MYIKESGKMIGSINDLKWFGLSVDFKSDFRSLDSLESILYW